jgi:putative membrane protein insertion efficiency factor
LYVGKKLLLVLITFYRKGISPYTPPSCRYIPTCSQYALEAIERYGAAKGFILALKRFFRCNPLHRGGYDPVP